MGADPCTGNGPDHCCYLAGDPCPFLEENTVPGRRWVCGLRRELGSWGAVAADERYLTVVRPVWDAVTPADGLPMPDCGTWGAWSGQCCYQGEGK